MSTSKRYLVTDGYKHVSKPNAIIITNVWSQASIRITRENWLQVMGADVPFLRTDASITNEEFKQLYALKML